MTRLPTPTDPYVPSQMTGMNGWLGRGAVVPLNLERPLLLTLPLIGPWAV